LPGRTPPIPDAGSRSRASTASTPSSSPAAVRNSWFAARTRATACSGTSDAVTPIGTSRPAAASPPVADAIGRAGPREPRLHREIFGTRLTRITATLADGTLRRFSARGLRIPLGAGFGINLDFHGGDVTLSVLVHPDTIVETYD